MTLNLFLNCPVFFCSSGEMHSIDPSLVVRDLSEGARHQVRRHGHSRGPESQRRVHQDGRLRVSGEGRLEQQQLRQRRPHRQHRKAIQR